MARFLTSKACQEIGRIAANMARNIGCGPIDSRLVAGQKVQHGLSDGRVIALAVKIVRGKQIDKWLGRTPLMGTSDGSDVTDNPSKVRRRSVGKTRRSNLRHGEHGKGLRGKSSRCTSCARAGVGSRGN